MGRTLVAGSLNANPDVVAIFREITDKHRALLQMYNKEMKANKRLSMDREQLMWRLTQESTATPPSPSLVSCSASNPVMPKSAPGTPLFTRHRTTVGTNMPSSRPLSQTDFRTFGPDDFIRDDSDEF